MHLDREESDMLEGKYGYPAQKSMEILVGLGECFDAERMIPVSSVHLLYTVTALGTGGTMFLQQMADQGGRFVALTHTNPVSFDSLSWKEFGVSEQSMKAQKKVVGAVSKMGALLADSCAPYMVGHVPVMGQHLAWNESSAVIFANSVLGARSNREGGPSALAAAITGKAPEYGFHLDQNRRGDLKIVVTAKLEHLHDYGTFGYFVGKVAQDRIPVIIGMPSNVTTDSLKVMGAAATTSGSVALFHVVGVTPEAPTEKAAFGGKRVGDSDTFHFGEKELRTTENALSRATSRHADVVILGCPHLSITELRDIARRLDGKEVKHGVELWVTTSPMVKTYAEAMGYMKIIEASGARVISGGCPVSTSSEFFKDSRSRTVVTNSARLTYYIGMYAAKGQEILPYYGSLERCVDAAITGRWR